MTATPAEHARAVAQRFAQDFVDRGVYSLNEAGAVVVPAGDLNEQELHVPLDEFGECLLLHARARRYMAAWSYEFFVSYYLGLLCPAHQVEWARDAEEHDRVLLEAPRSTGKSTGYGYGRVLQAICISSTGIGPDGHKRPSLRPDLFPADIRILLTTRGGGNATKRMVAVRNTLETNARLDADFGPFRVKGGKWTDTVLMCRRSLEGARLPDNTFECISVDGAVTGGRFDLLIPDDIEDNDSVNTESLRAKTREKMGNFVKLLDTGGRVTAIGTRKHADDWYARTEKNPRWRVKIHRAFRRWPGGTRQRDERAWELDVVTEPVDPDDPTRGMVDRIQGFRRIAPGAEVIWPDRPLPPDGIAKSAVEFYLLDYEETKATQGSAFWLREMQQKLTDDASAKFKLHWFDAAKARGRKLPLYRTHDYSVESGLRRLYGGGRDALGPNLREWLRNPFHDPSHGPRGELLIFASMDPSLVDEEGKLKQQDNDYTGLWVWGLNWQTKCRVLLDLFHHRWIGEGDIVAAVKGHDAAWLPIEFAIEKNSFGRLYVSHLRRTTDLPVHGHHTGKNKRDPFFGVTAMTSLFELRDHDPNSGKMILPYSDDPENAEGRALVDRLVSEFHGLGTEPHDDIVMSGWIGHSMIERTIAVMEAKHRSAVAMREAGATKAPREKGPRKPKRRGGLRRVGT